MPKQRHIRDGIYQGEDGFQYYSFRFKGKKHQGPTGYESRKKAIEFKRDLIARLAAQKAELAPPDAPDILVEGLWKAWKKGIGKDVSEAHKKRVARDWELHILPALGKTPAGSVTTPLAKKLRTDYLEAPSLRNLHQKKKPGVKRIQGPRSNAGANHLMAHLSLVYGWALEEELITTIPFKVRPLTEQEPVRHFLQLEDVEPFLAALDRITQAGAQRKAGKHPKKPVDALHVRIAVRMMLYCLLREEDAVGMKWRWFGRGFRTYTPGDTKGGEATTLPVPPTVRPLLALLKERASKDCPWVLPAEDGEPHRPQFTRKAIVAAGEAIGVYGLTPHRMRGTGATLMARSGASELVIQKAGRWKHVETVRPYVKIVEEDLRAAQTKAFNLSPTTVPQKKKAPEVE
jgi:integrase/recombinase XerC